MYEHMELARRMYLATPRIRQYMTTFTINQPNLQYTSRAASSSNEVVIAEAFINVLYRNKAPVS